MISIELRQREMLILRTIGLSAQRIFGLVLAEVTVLTLAGILLGLLCMLAGFFAMRGPLEAATGLAISLTAPSIFDVGFLISLLILSLASALWPAWRLYRQSLL